MGVEKAKIGLEDLEVGDGTFQRRGRTGFGISVTRLNLSRLPLAESTVANLPANAAVGTMYRVTDNIRGVWIKRSAGWQSLTGYADVRDFATGGTGTSGSPYTGWESAISGLSSGSAIYFAPEYFASSVAFDVLSGTSVKGSNGTTITATTNGQTIINVKGSHTLIDQLFLTKASGVTGVTGIVINPNGDVQANYGQLQSLRIEGLAGNLLTAGISVIAGQNVGGADMGAWYNSLIDIAIRYAVNGVKLDTHVANPNNGANGTRGYNVRVGDSTTGLRITRADTASLFGFAAEGCTTGVIIEDSVGADNNGNAFYGARFEANTLDISVAANSYFNAFHIAHPTTAKITDNGIGTLIVGATAQAKFPGYTYSDTTDRVDLSAGNGVRIGQASEFLEVVRKAVNGTSRAWLDLSSATGANDPGIVLAPGKGLVIAESGVGNWWTLSSVGLATSRRISTAYGTSLVAGDIALSAGWGSTASVSAISGTDQRFRFTVTSAGTGQGANPTATLTFKDGTWTTAPFANVTRNGGDQASVLPTWTTTATTLVITFPGTPVAGQTYTFEALVMG